MNPLAEAAKLLQDSGWTQHLYHEYREGTAHYCSLGALGHIVESANCTTSYVRAVILLSEVVQENYPETRIYVTSAAPIIAFNDDEKRTKEEVVAMFEKAAVKWEEQA